MRYKETLKFAFLLAVALGSAPAYSAFWQWSKTATNNATADPSINWSEGMSPSSVNDSARAMMARLAEQGADVSGSIVTGGTNIAYTVTTNQGVQTPTPVNGQVIGIIPQQTNALGVTLSADGGTAYPIQTPIGTAIPAGTMVANSSYTLIFNAANNVWLLINFYGQAAITANLVPLGALIPYTGGTVPNANFIFPFGQCISTTTYAAYWALQGSPAPGACGAGSFQVIDLRGRVLAALDTMPGSAAANRLTASSTGCGTAITVIGSACANGAESYTLVNNNLPPYTPSVSALSVTVGAGHGGAGPYLVGSGGTPIQFGGTGSGGNATSDTFSIANGQVSITMGAQGGISQALPKVPPLVGVTYILRVL